MEYYQITTTVYLKEDVELLSIGATIGAHINYCMQGDKKLSQLHTSEGFKFYCYDYLYPRAEEGTYKKDRIYVFKVRTPDADLAAKFRNVLNYRESIWFKPIGVKTEKIKWRYTKELYTVTPAVATLDKRNWVIEDEFDLIMERINQNITHKYEKFYGEEIYKKFDWIELFEIKNRKPIIQKYKKGKIFGNKFRIIVRDDEISQKLAMLAVSTGLLEKNTSVGAGFCIHKRG